MAEVLINAELAAIVGADMSDYRCRKKSEEGGKKDSGPFFLFCYVDDQVAVARGRGGGLALW